MKLKKVKTKTIIRKRNPVIKTITPDFILTDIGFLISELEDLKSIIRQNAGIGELRISVKNIDSLSEKILKKLAKRIKDSE